MKKVKHLVFALLVTLLSVVTVNAKQMTAKELGEEAAKIAPKARFIFVIGKYAYTSTYDKFNIQDVMLASSDSIELDKKGNMKDLVSTMTIYRIDRTYDKNYKPTGWSIGTNEIGNGKALGTTSSQKKIDIRYIDYVPMQEESEATISYNLDDTKYSKYKDVLEENLKFKQEEAYGDKLELVNGKLTGLLLKNNKITLSTEDQAKYAGAEYYFAYILEVPNASAKTTIKTDSLFGEGTISYSEFDVTDSGKTPGVVVLVPVSYEKWQTKKKITITIDLDGNDSEYAPTTQTIDLSGLTFQTDSTYEVKLNSAHADDKKIMSDWGYNDQLNKNLDLTDGKLTGTLIEQVLNSADVYGAGKETGYYYDFTFDLPSGLDVSKIKISSLKSEKGEESKTFIPKEYDVNGDLTLFPRIDPTTDCKTNADSCKLYFSIDLDGDGKEYLPVYYTLDYSQVVLEKASLFTIEALPSDDVDSFDEQDWYDTTHGYSVKVTKDEEKANTYKVSGVLPIFDDSDWTKDDPFDTSKNLYYLGLLLKLTNPPADFTNESNAMTVKFLHGTAEDKQYITKEDFASAKELYVLKALCENATDGSGGIIPDTEKVFTITIDLDGAGEEYAPYTVTIDWSELVLQTTSAGNFGNYDVIKEEGLDKNSQEYKDLNETYGYQFSADTEVNVKTIQDPENGEIKKGLEGKIKEQKLKDGTFNEVDGYFVPVKIEFPGKDIDGLEKYSHSWTIILNTEKGETKEYTPTQEEYNQGWVMVLFKIKNNGDKVIKYSIDFDGTPKAEGNEEHKGYDFIPEEYSISYADLSFIESNEVKVNGKTENNVSIYEGEPIPLEVLNKLEEEQENSIDEELKPYRDVAYFTTSSGTKVDETTKITSDMIVDGSLDLTTHWNLYATDFIGAVIEDLNSQDEESQSDDFHDKFIFEQDENNKNNIKIKIVDPAITLDTMNSTSIPGTIAYILLQDEIKDITLKIDESNSKKFDKNGPVTISLAPEENEISALKEKIQAEAKSLYGNILNEHFENKPDSEVTLSSLAASAYPSFQLVIGETANTITIANRDNSEVNKTYTFTFESTVAVVNTETEMKTALGNSKITDILVKTGFKLDDVNQDATNSHTLKIDLTNANRPITIKSYDEKNPVTISDDEKTTEGETDTTPVIEVKNGNVTFENIKIKGATRAITVDTGATVTAKNVTAVGSQDTAFDVSGTFTGTNLQYKTIDESKDKESYHYPTICGHGKVTVTDVENLKTVDNYQRIIHHTTGKYRDEDFKNPETGKYFDDFVDETGKLKSTYQDMIDKGTLNPPDFLSPTGHKHYYLKSENGDFYKFIFRDSRTNLIVYKYFAKGDTVTPPTAQYYKETEHQETGKYSLHFFIDAQVTSSGKTYVFDGWSRNENDNEDKVNATGTAVQTFDFPANTQDTITYYSHYTEGYRVVIPMDVEGTEFTGIFGIAKQADKELKIQDLMDSNETFKEVFEKQKQKAEEKQQKLLNKNNHAEEITENTAIKDNISIEIGTLQSDPGVSYTVGSLNETIEPNQDGKFIIPVNIKSENLQNNVSTITVTDPNGNQTVSKYSSATENGIATVSALEAENTITLNLEAIKAAKIKDGNKVYHIAVDVDGSENDKYAIANYTIDYNNTKTLEEAILVAAQNTQNASSFTIKKDNNIKGGAEKYTYKVDKKNDTRLYEGTINTEEVKQYTFKNTDKNLYFVVEKSTNIDKQVGKAGPRPKLNDWTYFNRFNTVANGINELELLKDLKAENGIITVDALTEIKKDETAENTYTVKVNKQILEKWLNATYIDGQITEDTKENTDNQTSDEASITLKVTLDNNDKYVTKIETIEKFTITNSTGTYKENTINVTINDIEKTTVDGPEKMLGTDGVDATKEQIDKFIQNGIDWWHKYTGSTGA